MKFRFEELLVYQQAVTFSNQIFDISKKWPQVYNSLYVHNYSEWQCLSLSTS